MYRQSFIPQAQRANIACSIGQDGKPIIHERQSARENSDSSAYFIVINAPALNPFRKQPIAYTTQLGAKKPIILPIKDTRTAKKNGRFLPKSSPS